MIRLFDLFISLIGLVILSPLLAVISLWILLDSKGGIFFHQTRVGKDGKDFRLIKFRSMVENAESSGNLTVGVHDSRITRAGIFLRRFKLDEIPQLFNVLAGEMSLVGPRPEVRKYVELYSEDQRKVLTVRPGITDYASIEYINENEILGRSANPEKVYIEEVMPAKIELNMKFIDNPTVATYFRILFKTLTGILS
ncbi:sugar transferase [Bacteroidota bacterium]